ncbi:YbaB/EbfC family nucleoid-associated protein [Mycolicibacterium sphagni]|uniref:YbaB/EbfC family nucleoid-associated protein n=1 Tax=Mycolicibacterium sphagni TaxID=1786 RepID=A0ABX2K0V0_9MYCO|nr:YbaB/EbfC family nucleoid-associated protein [Mycolicibacterium sphagni]NTY60703.1 YbaB/EbfC family nucleoid-associated protein [Mycolicibacterium sphagni]
MTTGSNQLPPGTHPQVAETMQFLEKFSSALSDQVQQVSTATFTGTDEDKTVEVTVDGARWLTGLHVEDGLLRLGADEVSSRINEALQNAQAAASESIREKQAQLYANLAGITQSMKNGLDLT